MSKPNENNPFMPDVEVVDGTESVNSLSVTFSQSSHPIVCFFHVVFKIVSVVLYIIGGFFKHGMSPLVGVILCISADFYVVKNISGRLLVGLRWWSITGENGLSNTWRYEITNKPEQLNKADNRFFWTTSYIPPIIWCIFSLFSLFTLNIKWLIACAIGVVLSTYNLYAYMMAAMQSKTKVSAISFIPKKLTKRMMEKVGSTAMYFARTSLAN